MNESVRNGFVSRVLTSKKPTLIVIPLLVASCNTNVPYQTNWAPLPSVAYSIPHSRYRAVSDRNQSLAYILIGETRDLDGSNWIALDEGQGQLTVVIGEDDSVIERHILYENKDYKVDNGRLSFVKKTGMRDADVAVAWVNTQYLLSTSTDGSLIAQKITRTYGLIMVVFPVWATDTSWIRWPVLE
ncbi:MAG: hypothetical protein WCH04_16235 [Gammaproteobacteria bacterium]